MKRPVEIEDGATAFERFQRALKAVLAVPKSALPPRPTRKEKADKKKS